jgi:radical SAM protein with 4Fe4S-binding SPASM domain
MMYGMNVSLSTNGVEASIEKSNLIASTGLEEIQVSIYAPDDKIHDSIVGVNGALNQSLKGLKNLIDAGLRVTVASVGTRMNHYCLPELAEQVADIGARYFRVLRLMPHTQNMLEWIVPYNEMLFLVERMKDLEKRREEFIISVHTSPGFEMEQFQNPRIYNIVHPLCNTCTAGKTSMAILSNGDCFPCIELRKSELFCGNILDTSLDKVWNSEPMSILRSITPDNYHGKCGECYSKWICYSARCVAYNLGGDFLGEDESCYRFLYDTPDVKSPMLQQ